MSQVPHMYKAGLAQCRATTINARTSQLLEGVQLLGSPHLPPSPTSDPKEVLRGQVPRA